MQRSLAVLVGTLGVFIYWQSGPAFTAEVAPLVLTLDKAQVLHLSAPARRVILANPAIADVTLETPTLLYVFAKAPGETSLVVLGDDNRTLFSRPVVVTSQSDRAVSVHVPGTDGPTDRSYSCVENRCLRVPSPDAVQGAGAPAAPTAASTPISPTAAAPTH
jgi:hypothetical protein